MWIKRGVKQGHGIAQYKLGFVYDKRVTVSQSYVDAFVWYKKTAKQRQKLAQSQAGDLYFNGRGIVQFYEEKIGTKKEQSKMIQLQNLFFINPF